MDYPDRDELRDILRRTTSAERPRSQPLGRCPGACASCSGTCGSAHLPDAIEDYIARLVLATHPDSPFAAPLARRYILYGASPRGAQSLALGGKAMARLRGREVVTAEDVRTVLVRSLQHRIILNFEGVASGIAPRDILANVLEVTRDDPARAEVSACSVVMGLPVSSVGMAWAGGSHHHGRESADWRPLRAGVAMGTLGAPAPQAGPTRDPHRRRARGEAALGAVSGALIGAAIGAGTGLATGVVLGTVDARQTGRERQQRDDHASTAWMAASAHQGPGTPAR